MDQPEENRAGLWLCRATGLLIFLVVAALYPWSSKPPVDIKELIAAWGAVTIVLALFFVQTTPRRLGPILITLLGYGGWMALASALSNHPGHSLHFLHLLATSIATAWAVSRFVSTEDHVRTLLKAMVWATALGSVYAFFQYLGIDPMPWAQDEMRDEAYTGLPGPFGNANLAAHALAVSIVGAVCLGWGRQFWVYGPLVIVFALHLWRTGQRGAIAALIAAAILCAIAIIVRRGSGDASRKAFVTIVSASVVGVVMLIAALGVHHVVRGYTMPVDSSVLMRYNAFFGASEMIKDAPLLGVGYGNYFIENPPYWTLFEQRWFASRLMSNGHVHNELLESGVEGGIIGAALHLAIFVMALWQSLRWAFSDSPTRRRLGMGLAAWIVVFFVDGLFGFNMRVPATALFFFVVLGAIAGLSAEARPPIKLRRLALTGTMTVCVVAALLSSVDFLLSYQMKYAVDARDQGHLEPALAAFRQVAPLNYWSWELAWEEARSLDVAGKAEASQRAFDDTNARLPYFPYSLSGAAQAAVHLARAPIEMDAARRGELLVVAKAHTDLALRLCPDLSSALEMKGRLALIRAAQAERNPASTGERSAAYREALDAYHHALLYGEGRRDSIYLAIAKVHGDLGDREKFHRAIRRAAEIAPNSSAVWAAFYGDGLQRGALDFFRETFLTMVAPLEQRPLYSEALYRYWNGDAPLVDVVDPFLRATEANKPVLTDVEAIRGHALTLDIFANAARTEISDNKVRARVFAMLGAHYLVIDSGANAIPLFEAALPFLDEADLVNISVYVTQYYWEQGDTKRARAIAEDAYSKLPQVAEIALMRARAFGKDAAWAAGLHAYNALLKNFPDLPADLRAIAEAEREALLAASAR